MREGKPEGMAAQQEIKVKKYRGEKAYERDANAMGADGWQVAAMDRKSPSALIGGRDTITVTYAREADRTPTSAPQPPRATPATATPSPTLGRLLWSFLSGFGAVVLVGLPGLLWTIVTGDSPGSGNLAGIINLALIVVAGRWFYRTYPWDGRLIDFLSSPAARPAWRVLLIWAAVEWAVLLGIAAIT